MFWFGGHLLSWKTIFVKVLCSKFDGVRTYLSDGNSLFLKTNLKSPDILREKLSAKSGDTFFLLLCMDCFIDGLIYLNRLFSAKKPILQTFNNLRKNLGSIVLNFNIYTHVSIYFILKRQFSLFVNIDRHRCSK